MFFTNLFESNLKVKNFAKKVIYYTSTDSTNDDIWELYAENNEQDIIIITDYQKKGRGRSGNIEFELRLSDGIRSLTAIDNARQIYQNEVDITVSGSVGIVPIRITNLFNNQTTIFRVGINSDSNKDTDLIRQIQEQGGTTIQS